MVRVNTDLQLEDSQQIQGNQIILIYTGLLAIVDSSDVQYFRYVLLP